ncbi:MarR family transcriptional regulator [Paenibacillus sp. OV219]|uniref:MarR family transcriptional regulator n=1 Tax=Paenibacillus sp. OV219 TaxID=1884377 RepID=UPI0008C936DB|nr:MarR family transcriptional regulator [Paenibacillus sp. OV219]SEO40894.1 hypothetical protein SAMN05518847_107325 [Paenibacillus sp. OV219]
MGAWGTGIFDDDTTCDVRDEYSALLEEGLSAEDASKSLLDNYHDEFEDEEDVEVMSLVYIGLAGAQLEKNHLLNEIRVKTIELIEKGADLSLWEDSEEEDLKERKLVLSEFKQKLLNSKY